jgi:kynurenine formamidase
MTVTRAAVTAAVIGVAALGAAMYGLGAARGGAGVAPARAARAQRIDLWRTYRQVFTRAKYIDLTHAIAPHITVWKGFGPSQFLPAVDPKTGRRYTYRQDGFEATQYRLATDQLGTQLDPPAHWAPHRAAIDELPPTFAVRPLVVISIVPQVRRKPDYALRVSDIRAFERRHGRIPRGSVVMVRSDWSKDWNKPGLAERAKFPGVGLAALKFLHLRRRVLFHGHEPLDTDTTPTLVGEQWLMHHGYTQAEGVANLDKVPATGCLIEIGYPKLKGGLGGYARYIAICPPSARHGVRIGQVPDAPLPYIGRALHWSRTDGNGTRVR